MEQIQGKSILVRVSEGSRDQESFVMMMKTLIKTTTIRITMTMIIMIKMLTKATRKMMIANSLKSLPP